MEFFPNAKESLIELQDYYHLIIVSIGTPYNIAYKAMWINDNLPFIKDLVFISNKDVSMNKSIVDMSGGIFIDDHSKNLISSNADEKFLFGKIFEWNEDWLETWSTDKRCFSDWNDARKHLIAMHNKNRQCGMCKDVIQDSRNLRTYHIKDRSYGSDFDCCEVEIKICSSCIKPEHEAWIWEKPVVLKPYFEQYKYEDKLQDLVEKCLNPKWYDPFSAKRISDFERYMYAED